MAKLEHKEVADCPFCGGKNLIIWGDSTIGGYYRWVQCEDCFAQGPRASSRAHDQNDDATTFAALEKWDDQWALQYLPVIAADAASGGGFDPYTAALDRMEELERELWNIHESIEMLLIPPLPRRPQQER